MRPLDADVRRWLGSVSPIIVANRAPLSLRTQADSSTAVVRAGGGLVTAMSAVARAGGAVWVAAGADAADRRLAGDAPAGTTLRFETASGDHYNVAYALPDEQAYEKHYNVASNPLLWLMQHYLWDTATGPVIDDATMDAWRNGYMEVNRNCADIVARIAAELPRQPVVMIQDYHLYPLAQMLRERCPSAVLQQFIHIPWPDSRYWSLLPREIRDAAVRGLLGNDIIGFQTSADARAFLRTCSDMGWKVNERRGTMRAGRRDVQVRNYPISIDIDEFRRLSRHPATLVQEREIERWRPEKLIVRVDRTDLSKNILRGFLAYEAMLEKHPEERGRVQFWAFLQPSRQKIDEYRRYMERVSAEVERINARFGRDGWEPIRLELGEDIHRAVAAYRNFDVLLVNSVMDGMNLVAKEGMLCNRRDGVLVLSDSCGAHEELGEHALSVSPFAVNEMADALHQALVMPAHQRREHARAIRSVIAGNDISRWIGAQVRDLAALGMQRSL